MNPEHTAAAQGEFVSPTPPFGYDRATVNRKQTLTPNSSAKYVELIFELRVDGKSMAAIAKHLTDLGVPTARGSYTWSSTSIASILRNPIYAGLTHWNGQTYPGLHPAIISTDLYADVQARKRV